MIASSLSAEIQGSVCGSPDVGVADPEPQGMRDFSVGRVGPALDADRRGSRILSCGRGGVRTGPEGVGGRRRSAGGSVEWQGVHHPGDTPWSQGLLMGMGGSEPGPGHGRARARGDPSESQDRRRCGRGAALHPRAASTQRRRREPRSQLRKDERTTAPWGPATGGEANSN